LNVILEDKCCTNASEFLQEISPSGATFEHDDPGAPWLFRGQGSDYPLSPSALRLPRPDEDTKLESLVGHKLDSLDKRAEAETQVILDFFEIADKRGLVLPDDSQQLRRHLWDLRDEESTYHRGRLLIKRLYAGDRNENVLSLIALAQHYGVPTRLLDWSFKPMAAAYFAAESALSSDLDGELIVWAFYLPVFGKYHQVNKDGAFVNIVTAPSATNPNLAAQQGIFTLPQSYKTASGKKVSFDRIIQQKVDKINKDGLDLKHRDDKLISECKLRKFSLPQNKAPELLRLLAKHDVTRTSIYPGYASIERELEIRTKWLIR